MWRIEFLEQNLCIFNATRGQTGIRRTYFTLIFHQQDNRKLKEYYCVTIGIVQQLVHIGEEIFLNFILKFVNEFSYICINVNSLVIFDVS